MDVARHSISKFLEVNDKEKVFRSIKKPKDRDLLDKGGSFVTLRIDKNLRGCIGSIEAHESLYLDVAENAIHAAFFDPRFEPLTKEEAQKIGIEISVLSRPKPLSFISPEDLLAKLQPNKDGVVLKFGLKRATFLPQVWEELPDKKDFLGHLCSKAGLDRDCWKKRGVEIDVYHVFSFGG